MRMASGKAPGAPVFFNLTTLELSALLAVIVIGTTVLGVVIGRSLRRHTETLREPFGVLQAAILGFMGLILAFGLSLAVGRSEARRTALVDDANAIGTTYLRAQTLHEPARSASLALLQRYATVELSLTHAVPDSPRERRALAVSGGMQRQLWSIAGQSLAAAPVASAPRLYLESLNAMIDAQGVRVAALNNRVPTTVLLLEIIGAAVALGLLAVYLAMLGRGVAPVFVAAALVTGILLVTFDLDRPTRGFIRDPTTPLTSLIASMQLPPAASAPP
jgi:hypothetical protein